MRRDKRENETRLERRDKRENKTRREKRRDETRKRGRGGIMTSHIGAEPLAPGACYDWLPPKY